jgi:predicted nucleic acid-binding protein
MILTLDNEYSVVFDACVLVPMPLCDTLLRCAEEPALFRLAWSNQTLEEVEHTLAAKLGYTEAQASRRVQAMREAFPEAVVNFPKSLIHSCEGIPDPDDRHVVAAAIHCHSHAIITANLKHFPKDCLGAHDILVQSPDDFLKHQFHLNGDRMLEVLDIQASAIGKERGEILELLKLDAPGFVELIRKKF